MNILILGYGLEGKSAESYFKSDPNLAEHTKIDILDKFTPEDLKSVNYDDYDLIFRTPSVRPDWIPTDPKKITSVTKFFFSNCKAEIIGVTGTKGKGTTCTLIRDILEKIQKSNQIQSADASSESSHVFLLGNIGSPALDALPEITESDIVVYELSSFQLWDLEKSPSIAVTLRIEPDHLDVHKNFEEYLSAKENIAKSQSPEDFLIYFKENENTKTLASLSPAKKFPYPLEPTAVEYKFLTSLLKSLKIPGEHNKENAEAALFACYAYFCKTRKASSEKIPDFLRFLKTYETEIKDALENFKPLPHHIEFVRELSGVKYYDDSFSTVLPSLEAAIKSFPETPLVLIAGGKDKGFPLEPVKRLIFDNPYLIKAVLIGETAEKLAKNEDPEKYYLAFSLKEAVETAKTLAEEKILSAELSSDNCLVKPSKNSKSPVVLLSPCASSFDMFKSYKDRGDQFKTLVNSLEETPEKKFEENISKLPFSSEI